MTIRYGTSGDDTIVALQSTDTLVGLEGNDIFDFSGFAGVTVLEEAGGGTDTILSTSGMVLPEFVENFVLVGAVSSLITGNALANRLEGGDNGDTLDGAGGLDTLMGGDGGDIYLVGDSRVVVIEALTGGADAVRASANYTLAANIENGFLDTGSAATTLTGNALANSLIGNELANVLDGAAGNDTIAGDTGNDTLRGGDGNDIINGNADNDLLDGGAGNDELGGNDGNDRLLGGAGNDTLEGGTGRDTLEGGAGNDTYQLTDTDGDDVIVEAATGGIDTVRVDSLLLSFTAAAGIEAVLVHGGTAFTLVGNAAANTLVGGTGADRIEGLAGNDAIDGSTGVDTMIGGLGNDQYTVDTAGDQVIEIAGTGSGSDRVFSSIANYTLPANVERLMLVGQSSAVNGVGNALDNVVDGNEVANRLEGGAGNDLLDGHAGVDMLVGGSGNDTFVVDVAGDSIVELSNGGLADVVRVAADITYTMADGIESALVVAPQAHVIGNRAANTITGGVGGDLLDGGRGIDRLIGGTGNDTYYVDNEADVIVEITGGGTDTVYSSKQYTLLANVERLVLLGSAGAINGTGSLAGNDTITGNGSTNVLTGLGGNDELYGLGGSDTLRGGDGNDRLDGGTGVNSFDGGNGDDTYVVSGTQDTIADSGGRDLVVSNQFEIRLSNYGATVPVVGFVEVPLEDLQLAEGAMIRNGFGNALANSVTGNAQRNLLDGGAGNDFIDGAGGIDTVRGGSGNDTMRVSDVGEVVVENADSGTDTVLTSLSTFSLAAIANVEKLIYEGVTNATLTGNTLANSITGGIGNDSIDGGTGFDSMIGGIGNDTYLIDSVGDLITEAVGGGTDTVEVSVTPAPTAPILIDLTAATSTATRLGLLNVENVTILGTGLYNITGNASDNILIGNGSSNTIIGGAGNDSIDGGGGTAADSMVGGTGDDTYVVNLGNGATGGQLATEDIVTELANGGRDMVFVATASATANGGYALPDFVDDLQGTVGSNVSWAGNALNNAIDLTITAGGANTIISPGLGTTDSVTVRGLASGTLTVTDTDGTDFVSLVLSGGASTLNLQTGVDDIRFQLLSGTSTETANFAANATVLVTGAGSLTLNGVGVSNAYTLSDFTGTLTLGATAAGPTDTLALDLLDVQGALATSNNAIETFALDSQGSITNTLVVSGVAATSAFSVTGDTALDLTGIGNSGFNVRLDGFTGARLGLAAQAPGSAQNWTVTANGSATEIAIAAGADANLLAIDTTGTGGASILAVTGESTTGTISLAGNQGLSLLGVSGGTVSSTMDGSGVVLRATFDGATGFTVTSGLVDTDVTGSSGADTFLYGASLDSNDVVAGGGGADSLTATLAANTGAVAVPVAPNITAVESMTFNVLGRYLLDANAMDAATVTVTGGGGAEISDPTLEVQNGRGDWDASTYTRRMTFTAAADADGVTVIGGTKIDVITGSAGDDVIDAKAGAGNTVTGGDGSDIFRFTTTANGVANGIDVTNVTDFQSGVDHLQLANELMAGLGADGALDPSLFASYASQGAMFASGAAGVLKYLSSAGQLFYDADGIGSGTPINQIMTLSFNGSAAPVTAADFTVI